METKPICPSCHKPLPADVPLGLCPECLIKSSFQTGTEPSSAGFEPPPIEEVANWFPQLEIIELLGRGGMGAVYKARQPRLDRLVALKILSPEKLGDSHFAERFAREAQALARLSHPSIVTVHDFGEVGQASRLSRSDDQRTKSEADGTPVQHCYLIMEFVDGLSLRQLLQAGKIKPEEALAIVPKICEALQYAHEQGIVHRDIKPENILLDKQGRVKIADFGIAKIVGREGERPNLTAEKQVIGTPHYMAPEQVEKPQLVDHRADIFSLGVVFYEMLTGELPLGKFQPPSRKVQVDVRLDEVVLHALEKEPDRRYQHASEVKTDVETIAADSATASAPFSTARPPGLPVAATQVERRRKAMLWYGFFASLIGLPVGLDLRLPYVWGLSIAGLVICTAKLGFFTGILSQRKSGDANEQMRQTAPGWIVAVRWVARLLCVFGLVMLLLLIFGKNSILWHAPSGSSSPINWMWPIVLKGGTSFTNPSSPALLWCCTSATMLMLGGFIAGWWRDGLATLLMLTGWALFQITERYVTLLSWFHLAAMAGVLFGVAWSGNRQKKWAWSLGIIALPILLGLLLNFTTIQRVSATVAHSEVGKVVTEFPDHLDLSSPATASAAMWRAYARMDTQTISRIRFVPANPQQYEDWFRKEQQRDAEGMAVYLKTRIIAVQTWRDTLASVIASIPFPPGTDRMRYDNQYFARVNGRWKFLYEDREPDLAAAKSRLELTDGKRTLCQAFTTFSDQVEERDATSPDQASLMKLVQQYFFFNDHNIAFRQSIEWGTGRTNLDRSRSIRYKYRAELWKGGAVTNDTLFTCDQNRVVSVKDYANPTTTNNPPAGTQSKTNQLVIEFKEAPLRDAIQNLAKHIKRNIAFAPQLELDKSGPNGRSVLDTRVNLRWVGVPGEKAFGALLDNYGLQAVQNPATGISRIEQKRSDKPTPQSSSPNPPPVVVSTVPQSGATDVDPKLTELQVTFSKRMSVDRWSWVKLDDSTFPETTGQSRYLNDHRTCVLPVKLEPNHLYATWINVDNFQDFQGEDKQPALPYLLIFKTGK